MVKQQKIGNRTKKKETTVIREKKLPPTAPIDPKYANAPVRTVHFVEVGNMSQTQLRYMLSELSRVHDTAKGGIHYILPVRNGKIGPDMVFEEEWLSVVRKTCEINTDGEIVLKGGAREVLIIRDKV